MWRLCGCVKFFFSASASPRSLEHTPSQGPHRLEAVADPQLKTFNRRVRSGRLVHLICVARRFRCLDTLLSAAPAADAPAHAQPAAAFPGYVGPGSPSRQVFEIENPNPTTVRPARTTVGVGVRGQHRAGNRRTSTHSSMQPQQQPQHKRSPPQPFQDTSALARQAAKFSKLKILCKTLISNGRLLCP